MGMVRLIIKEHCFNDNSESVIEVMRALAVHLENAGLLPITSVVEVEHIPTDGKPVNKYASGAMTRVESGARLLLKDCAITGSTQVPPKHQGARHEITIRLRTFLSAEEYKLPVTADFITELGKRFPDGGPAICDIELCVFPKEDPVPIQVAELGEGRRLLVYETKEDAERAVAGARPPVTRGLSSAPVMCPMSNTLGGRGPEPGSGAWPSRCKCGAEVGVHKAMVTTTGDSLPWAWDEHFIPGAFRMAPGPSSWPKAVKGKPRVWEVGAEDEHLADFVAEEVEPQDPKSIVVPDNVLGSDEACPGFVTSIRDEKEACLHCGRPKAVH